MAKLSKVKAGDPIIDGVVEAISKAKEPSSQMRVLCYTAGKIFRRPWRIRPAFEYFERAKKQDPHTFSPERAAAYFKSVAETFNANFLATRKDWGVASERPGLHRRHAALRHDPGRTNPRLPPRRLRRGRVGVRRATHSRHSRLRPERAIPLGRGGPQPRGSGLVCLPVSPQNRGDRSALSALHRQDAPQLPVTGVFAHHVQEFACGALHQAPRRHDPLLLQHDFAHTHDYNQSLDGLTAYYVLYRELMEHWSVVAGDCIHPLQYEKLVENQEDQSRKLIEFAGLGWDPGVLASRKMSAGFRPPVRGKCATRSTPRRAAGGGTMSAIWRP